MGQVVGLYFDNIHRDHGFLYSNGTFTTIDDPLAVDGGTAAMGINNQGQIVGDYYNGDGTHGFVANPQLATTTPPTSVQQEILGLYAALYNRAAEFPGYSYWVSIVGQQSDQAG